MFKALSRINLWNAAIVVGIVALTAGLANEFQHRVALSGKLAQSRLREVQMEAALRTEALRAGKLEQVLAVKAKEVDELVSRLDSTTRRLSALESNVAARDLKITQLQTELIMARQSPADAAAGQDAKDAARVELEKIAVSMPGSERADGRVVGVDRNWEFVVVNLGWNAVNIGDVVNIYRDSRLVAQAQVERLQETAAAARVLAPYQTAKIELNDAVVPSEDGR